MSRRQRRWWCGRRGAGSAGRSRSTAVLRAGCDGVVDALLDVPTRVQHDLVVLQQGAACGGALCFPRGEPVAGVVLVGAGDAVGIGGGAECSGGEEPVGVPGGRGHVVDGEAVVGAAESGGRAGCGACAGVVAGGDGLGLKASDGGIEGGGVLAPAVGVGVLDPCGAGGPDDAGGNGELLGEDVAGLVVATDGGDVAPGEGAGLVVGGGREPAEAIGGGVVGPVVELGAGAVGDASLGGAVELVVAGPERLVLGVRPPRLGDADERGIAKRCADRRSSLSADGPSRDRRATVVPLRAAKRGFSRALPVKAGEGRNRC